mmetsp:Transcript_2967/g.6519  ORF Transcript_2967/g.6519 Transcript_2967/m.6519 type:complete len:207 (-) Transcript_2967:80-700(-)
MAVLSLRLLELAELAEHPAKGVVEADAVLAEAQEVAGEQLLPVLLVEGHQHFRASWSVRTRRVVLPCPSHQSRSRSCVLTVTAAQSATFRCSQSRIGPQTRSTTCVHIASTMCPVTCTLIWLSCDASNAATEHAPWLVHEGAQVRGMLRLQVPLEDLRLLLLPSLRMIARKGQRQPWQYHQQLHLHLVLVKVVQVLQQLQQKYQQA